MEFVECKVWLSWHEFEFARRLQISATQLPYLRLETFQNNNPMFCSGRGPTDLDRPPGLSAEFYSVLCVSFVSIFFNLCTMLHIVLLLFYSISKENYNNADSSLHTITYHHIYSNIGESIHHFCAKNKYLE